RKGFPDVGYTLLRLGQRCAWLKASDDLEEIVVGSTQRGCESVRDPERRTDIRICAVESSRGNADDLERLTVKPYNTTKDVRIPNEVFLPAIIRKDCHQSIT